MANFKVPANISYSKGAEIEKNHNVYFAECEDRPRGKKNIAVCCLQGAGLLDSALPCSTR